MLSLKPKHLKRYKDIALLLIRYGRSDLVHQVGLGEALDASDQLTGPTEVAKAEDLASDLESLGPTFIKLGQLLSTRPDLLPTVYLEALTRLQDRVEPFAYEEVEHIVTSELGVRLSRAFATFETTPIASASLSQVHRAELRDGRLVAVKVQRPRIRERIVDDLDALEDLAELLDQHTEVGRHYQFQRLLETLRRALLRELDFRNEAQNLRTMHHNVRDFKRIVVPQPIDDYTSTRVLTMQYIAGPKITSLSPMDMLEQERQELAEELFRAYLHQVLVDGFFHADPHPGNLCFTKQRQIGLLDLGLTVRIPPRLQERIVRLLLAVAEGRGEEAADAAIKVGHETKSFDKAEFHERIVHLVTENQNTTLEQVRLGHVILQLQGAAADTGIRLPEEITMLSKTLLNLEKTLTTLNPCFDLNEAIRRRAAEILQKRTRSQMSMGGAYHALMEMNEFATLLPERMNKIMDLIAENKLRMHVDAIDEAQLIQGIQKVANRITMGLVLAALIVGAALMMDVETSLTVFGYPAIAIFFFLTAGTGALVLVWQILFTDRRDY